MDPSNENREFRKVISDEVIRETLRRVTGKKGKTHRRVANRAFAYAMREFLSIEEALAFVLLCGVAYGNSLMTKMDEEQDEQEPP
jgi:hypothetical protein